MSTFSSLAGDGGDTLGFGSRLAGVEAAEVSPIEEEVAEAATAVVDGGGNRNIGRLDSDRKLLPQATRDWSNLPKPAIQLILMGLWPAAGDVFSFAGICKEWLSVFADCKRELLLSFPPLLVDCRPSPDALGRFYCHFYSLVERRFLRQKQPIEWWISESEWRVIGVSHGYWIITAVKYSERRPQVFLWDPLFPQSRIKLPPATQYNRSAGEAYRLRKFSRALLTAPLASPDCLVVGTDKNCIWYCRPGDAKWVRHEFLDREHVAVGLRSRVAVLGRQLYSLTSFRKLVVMELLFPLPRVAVMDVEGLPLDYDRWDDMLVESDGEILYIARKDGRDGDFGPDVLPRFSYGYTVLRLDLPAQRWVVLDTLGKRSIFLPDGWPWTPVTCLGAAEGRENCIYSVRSKTLSLWSMKDRSLEHQPLPPHLKVWSVPTIWWTRILCPLDPAPTLPLI